MKKITLFLILLCSMVNAGVKNNATDLTVIEVTTTSLQSVYYHQVNFPTPTKLVFTNLTSVSDYVYFYQNVNLVEVEFPNLTITGGYFYAHGNQALTKLNAPLLNTVHGYLYVSGNTSLTETNFCSLQNIVNSNGNSPYLFLNNTPAVDTPTPCFSQGAPQNLTLSGNTIAENLPINTFIGTLHADSNYPNGSMTYTLINNTEFFKIEGNQLKSKTSFDFEANSSYVINIKATNQLGENITAVFTITINNEVNENLTVIEITDTTLDNVYYHQVGFTTPTKLVFTNLTSVSGYVYFHQNVNLVEVEFPALIQTGGYFYAHQNLSLAKLNAPALQTIHNYLYVNGNSSLTEANFCSLQNIIGTNGNPPYTFHNNTPAVDGPAPCFSQGAPQNLTLSGNTISENLPINILIGTLHADSNYPNGTMTYTLNNLNNLFKIEGNQLKSKSSFDFEANNSYTLSIKATNQLGESITSDFTVTITNQVNEDLTVIEITDTTLDNVYYHQVSFTTPTKLVFTNLTSVGGYVYFHQNVNLMEVEFPALTQTGNYFYVNGNLSLTSMKAPVLATIHNYLYVTQNLSLAELDVCNLSQILPVTNMQTPYYYVQSNPLLNFDTTCLVNTTIEFIPVNPIVILPAPNTLIGNFTSDAEGTLTYYFVDATGNPTTNGDFIIVGDGLYLAHEYDYYQTSNFTIDVGAIRVNSDRHAANATTSVGLNEKIKFAFSFSIVNGVLGNASFGTNHSVLYPNPTNDNFIIANNFTENASYEIYDFNGKLLRKNKVESLQSIDIHDFQSGIYLVKITSEEFTETHKLVKN